MKKSRKSKKRSGKKKSGSRFGKLLLLFLFFLTAAVVYRERADLVGGVKTHLLRQSDPLVVKNIGDLPVVKGPDMQAVKTVGIPDYKNSYRFPFQQDMLTCYRMLGFENRMFVCTGEELKPPEEIDEIIRPRAVKGRLVRLDRSPLETPLRRGLKRTHRIVPADDALVC